MRAANAPRVDAERALADLERHPLPEPTAFLAQVDTGIKRAAVFLIDLAAQRAQARCRRCVTEITPARAAAH